MHLDLFLIISENVVLGAYSWYNGFTEKLYEFYGGVNYEDKSGKVIWEKRSET
jgi:hypothetical protein